MLLVIVIIVALSVMNDFNAYIKYNLSLKFILVHNSREMFKPFIQFQAYVIALCKFKIRVQLSHPRSIKKHLD